jgi:hypothetical protein
MPADDKGPYEFPGPAGVYVFNIIDAKGYTGIHSGRGYLLYYKTLQLKRVKAYIIVNR